MRSILVPLAVIGGACAQTDPTVLDLRGSEGLVALIATDAAGQPARVSEVRVLPEDQRLPPLSLGDEDSGNLSVLLIPRQALLDALPGWGPEDHPVTIEPRPRPAEPIRSLDQHGQLFVEIGLPSAATLLEPPSADGVPPLTSWPRVAEPRFSATLASLSLRAPIDPEYCRSPFSKLVPFAATEKPFAELLPSPVAGLRLVRSLLLLDRVRLLAIGPQLFLVERGRPFVDEPRPGVFARLTEERFPLPQPKELEAGLWLERDVDERDRVAVVGYTEEGHGVIWELAVDDTVAPIRLLYEASEFSRFHRISRTPQGLYEVVAEGGTIFRFDTDWTLVGTDRLLALNDSDRYTRVVYSEDPIETAFVGSREGVEVKVDGVWQSERFVSLGLTQAINGVVVDENHLEGRLVWGVGQYGGVFVRKGRQPFGQVQMNWPPRAALCLGHELEASPQLRYGFYDASLDTGHIYLGLESCNALVALRTSDECLSLIPNGDLVPTDDAFEAVEDFDGEVYAATRYGAIYVAE